MYLDISQGQVSLADEKLLIDYLARRMSKLFLYFYYSISLALHVAHNNMKKKVSNNNFTEVPIYQRFTFLI